MVNVLRRYRLVNNSLEDSLRKTVYGPVLERLKRMLDEDVEEKVEAFIKACTRDPLLEALPGGLGSHVTLDALYDLGMAPDDAEPWWDEAYSAIRQTVRSLTMPLPQKPAARMLFVWFGYELS